MLNSFTDAHVYLFKTSAIFHIEFPVFFLFYLQNFFILDMSPLSDKYFENILSRSVACLLLFLMSFYKQKANLSFLTFIVSVF